MGPDSKCPAPLNQTLILKPRQHPASDPFVETLKDIPHEVAHDHHSLLVAKPKNPEVSLLLFVFSFFF
jgi:hypothetical protein